MRKLHYIAVVIILFFTSSVNAQNYTGSYQTFDVSKPNYKEYNWQNLPFETFRIHYYGVNEAHDMAERASVYTNEAIKNVEAFFDTDLNDIVDVVIFNSYDDLYYSNISEVKINENNIGGDANMERFRVVVYSDGDEKALSQRITEGVAEVAINSIVYGSEWTDVLKSNTFLTLPDWYVKGLASYISNEWSFEIDNKVRQGILNGTFKNPFNAEGEKTKTIGHAIWRYIAEDYGKNVIQNIVYLTRISTNVESGFAYVLGANFEMLSNDYYQYYYRIYSGEKMTKLSFQEEEVKVKIKKNESAINTTVSPDKKWALYVLKKDGNFYWELKNLETGKLKKTNKTGYKYIKAKEDFAPVFVWHPSSEAYVVFYSKKGELKADLIDLKGDVTSKTIKDLDLVTSGVYNTEGKQIAISGVKEGQSDIYLYSFIGNTAINVTNDFNSDLSPSFLANQTEVVYTSLKEGNKNYDVYKVNTSSLKKTQLTNTPLINEISPLPYKKEFSYLANNNGIYNRYRAKLDSSISYVDTSVHYRYFTIIESIGNYPFSASNIQSLENNEYFLEVDGISGQMFFIGSFSNDKVLDSDELNETYYKTLIERKKLAEKTPKSNTSNYEKKTVDFSENDKKKASEEENELRIPSRRFYEKDLSIVKLTTQFDYSFLNQSYQLYNQKQYKSTKDRNDTPKPIGPELGLRMGAELSDVFDDYRLTANYRIKYNFRDSELQLKYENLSKKVNKGYFFSRTYAKYRLQQTEESYLSKVQTYNLNGWSELPLNPISALKLTYGVRSDIISRLGLEVDDNTFNYVAIASDPTEFLNRLTTKLEYNLNNSYSPAYNIRYGYRAKLFAEAYVNPADFNQRTFTYGADIRLYKKIYKGIVWANRFTVNSSIGTQKVLYLLGGQNNWLLPKYDNQTALAQETSFIYQTTATPMRGFIQNTRNGNSFAVINSELRIPLIKAFSPTPIRSEFLEHFQVIAFGDVGSAWTGLHPYSNENSFNVKIIDAFPLTVRIKNTQEPLVYAYGFGLRSKLFGYYVRVDFSWGIDDGEVNSLNYLTLSLDF